MGNTHKFSLWLYCMFNTDDLNDFFNHYLDQANHPKKIIIAYSGGLDSTVLLYSLTRINLNIPIVSSLA